MQPFQNPHRIQWHVTVDAFVSHIDRSFIFSIKRSNFVIFKILLHENSIFNNPELPFSFFRRQFTKKFELCIWILETPFIYRLFRGMENRAFITFVALFGFPQIVAGIVEMLLIVFFFFLFFLHEAGGKGPFIPPSLSRGNESDGARVTRPGSIKGEHGLAGWIYAGYPRGERPVNRLAIMRVSRPEIFHSSKIKPRG